MSMARHEKNALRFLLQHLAGGVAGAVLFGGLLLYFDIAHLRTLATESQDGWLTIVLLFFGLMVTFGGVAMAAGVMALAQDDN